MLVKIAWNDSGNKLRISPVDMKKTYAVKFPTDFCYKLYACHPEGTVVVTEGSRSRW